MAWSDTDETYLQALYSARLAILTGKSYSIAGKSLTRADETWISQEVGRLELKKAREGAGSTFRTPVFGTRS